MSIMDKVAAGVSGGVSKKTVDEALKSFSSMGYRNFEVWLYGGRGSTFDLSKGADYYIEKGRQYGLGFSSLHLPPVEGTDDETFRTAVDGALFAEALGIRTVVCGPGHIEQAHKPDEFIELSQLAACEDFIGRLIREHC